MKRLFNAHVQLVYKDEHGEASVSSSVADSTAFWWNPKRPDERMLWESKIELGEKFFNEVIRHPVPLDMNTLTALKRSPLGLDLYLWLVSIAPSPSAPRNGSPGSRCTGNSEWTRPKQVITKPSKTSAVRSSGNSSRSRRPELHDGQGRLDPRALETRNPSSGTAPARQVTPVSPFPVQNGLLTAQRLSRVLSPLKATPGASCGDPSRGVFHKYL